MKNYYRVMLGRKSIYAKEAYAGNYIGVGWLGDIDLTNKLPDTWKEFNEEFVPIYLSKNPDRSKVAAGLACGMLHIVCKQIQIGDIILCPDGDGNYYVGQVDGEYQYVKDSNLSHRRSVKWFSETFSREQMSDSLKNSSGSIGTVCRLSKFASEIESLISGKLPSGFFSTDEDVEDPSVFALEKHLEDFLVENWTNTEIGKSYDIYEEEGEMVGQQFPSDTGPIDILAISKDKKELLVVELKKGRTSDVVVGQIQRYMGYVKEELAEETQTVKGVIIAFEDDLKIKRALSVTENIDLYTYKINFKLDKVN